MFLNGMIKSFLGFVVKSLVPILAVCSLSLDTFADENKLEPRVRPEHLVLMESHSGDLSIGVLVVEEEEHFRPIYIINSSFSYRFEEISVPEGKLFREGRKIFWSTYNSPEIEIAEVESEDLVSALNSVYVEKSVSHEEANIFKIRLVSPVELVYLWHPGDQPQHYEIDISRAHTQAEQETRDSTLLSQLMERRKRQAFQTLIDEKRVFTKLPALKAISDAYKKAFMHAQNSVVDRVENAATAKRDLVRMEHADRPQIDNPLDYLRQLLGLYFSQLEAAETFREGDPAVSERKMKVWSNEMAAIMEEIAITLAHFTPPDSFAAMYRVWASELAGMLGAGALFIAGGDSVSLPKLLILFAFMGKAVAMGVHRKDEFLSPSSDAYSVGQFPLMDGYASWRFSETELPEVFCREVHCSSLLSRWRTIFETSKPSSIQGVFTLMFQAIQIASGQDISILVQDASYCDVALKPEGTSAQGPAASPMVFED